MRIFLISRLCNEKLKVIRNWYEFNIKNNISNKNEGKTKQKNKYDRSKQK